MIGDRKDDAYYMQLALLEAKKAADKDEVPVGCVITDGEQVIARAYNQVETLHDATAHAEMIALTQAMAARESKWLNGCTVYVTIEPCLMCSGAFVLARVDRVVYGASEPKTGALGSVVNTSQLPLNHTFAVTRHVLEAECAFAIQEFFKRKRKAQQ